MAGVFLICPVSGWILLVSVYGLFWNQILVITLSVSLIGLALGYGMINIIKGNEITKQLAKATLKNFGVGAAIASIIGLVLVIFKTVSAAALGEYYYWTDESFLIVVMSRVLITAIPAGGIGGAILGLIWKHKLAAILGGIVGEILIAPIFLMMFPSR